MNTKLIDINNRLDELEAIIAGHGIGKELEDLKTSIKQIHNHVKVPRVALNRSNAAIAMDLSEKTLIRLEQRGKLRRMRNVGKAIYSIKELSKLAE